MHLRDDTGHDYEWSGGGGHGAEITRADDTFVGPVNQDAQALIVSHDRFPDHQVSVPLPRQ
jgi:hypothetical protein